MLSSKSFGDFFRFFLSRFKRIFVKFLPRSVFEKMIYFVFLFIRPPKLLSAEQLIHKNVNSAEGVNFVGFNDSAGSLGKVSRLAAEATKSNGVAIALKTLSYQGSKKPNVQLDFFSETSADQDYNINIIAMNPFEMKASVIFFGKKFFEKAYDIGFWAWELNSVSKEWLAYNAPDYVHEIWSISSFSAEAIQKSTKKLVLPMPLSVFVNKTLVFNRHQFGLPENKFLFLYVFDLKSLVKRKNPQAAIKAFQQAFHRKNTDVGLVLKFFSEEEKPLFMKEAESDDRIYFINQILSDDESVGLKMVCDCFISLHRSEGFGLNIAESMLLGKPVIATGYSGNMDFMNEQNSCIVNYDLIEVKKGDYCYHTPGQLWAEPDLEHAAWYMQKVFNDSYFRKEISIEAEKAISENYNLKTVGALYVKRLKEVGLIAT